MRVAILQSNYIPWKGYFDLINDADIFVFYDEVQYTKNDWRNRNKIYSKNGIHWLTIPVAKDSVKLKISEVKMENPLWQEKHYKSLELAYGRADNFNYISPLLIDVYKERKWEYLSELNQYLTVQISRHLGIQTQFMNSADIEFSGNRVERLINLLIQLKATDYISGPSARNYLEGSECLFAENSINLIYKEYRKYPKYVQFERNFENAVSVIDILSHLGMEASKYIWGG